MSDYFKYVDELKKCLNSVVVTRADGSKLDADQGLDHWCAMTADLMQANKTMYFAGNGASAMMASHMAADASKNGGFRALAFNDPALMTAVSNDVCYEQSFALPLKRFADPGDMLVTISSSGNSPNVVAALEAAGSLGLKTVTLSGMKEDNKSRQMGDLNFYVPGITYGMAECSHQAILHCWLDVFMARCEARS
ncbi:MAG: SIS domain-containing protein [Desulfatirhabdiaceae bacterium]